MWSTFHLTITATVISSETPSIEGFPDLELIAIFESFFGSREVEKSPKPNERDQPDDECGDTFERSKNPPNTPDEESSKWVEE